MFGSIRFRGSFFVFNNLMKTVVACLLLYNSEKLLSQMWCEAQVSWISEAQVSILDQIWAPSINKALKVRCEIQFNFGSCDSICRDSVCCNWQTRKVPCSSRERSNKAFWLSRCSIQYAKEETDEYIFIHTIAHRIVIQQVLAAMREECTDCPTAFNESCRRTVAPQSPSKTTVFSSLLLKKARTGFLGSHF